MVRTRFLGLLLWSVGLSAGLVIAAERAGSESTPAASARKLVVPDEYATIQAAVRDAKEGDTVFLKAGTYREAVELKSGVRLLGEQKDTAIVEFDESKSILTMKGCTDISISGLTIRHVATSRGLGRNAGVIVESSTVVIEDCRIAEAAGTGIEISDGANATVRSCKIEDNGARGIEVKNSTATIRDCEIVRNKVLGITLIGRQTSAMVRSCRISGSQFAGLGFWLGAGGTAQENEIHDNEVGIEVRDACEDVVLFQNNCHGNKRDGIRVYAGAKARAEQNLCEENRGRGITVCGAGTIGTLEKNRCLRNAEYGILVYQGGDGVLTGNECAQNGKEGIYVTEAAGEIRIEDNRCTDNQQTGITVFDTGAGVIANNHCASNMRYGIYIRKTTGMVSASANTCVRNQQDGIVFAGETQSTVENNVCSENGTSGINFRSGARALAEANTCEANRCPGIWVEDPDTAVTLRRNTCRANNDSGILFFNVADGEAEGNICRENLWSGIAVRGERATPTLTANQCNNNGAWGIISWAGANPHVSADNETLDNWKGGIKHRSPAREEAATPSQR